MASAKSKGERHQTRRRPRRRAGTRGRGAPPLAKNVMALRALAHPLRLKIAELLAEAPRTTTMVAALLGVPPTRLYHHVKGLERAGLVRLREVRPKRGVEEKWYEMVPPVEGLRTGLGWPGRRVRRALVPPELVTMLLDQARRDVSSALADPRSGRPFLGRLVAVGSPARIAAIRQKLRRFMRDLRQGRERWPTTAPPGGPSPERWGLTIAFAPAAVRTND